MSNRLSPKEFWPKNRSRIISLILALILLLGLFYLWQYSPLASWSDPELLREKLSKIKDHQVLPLVLIALYLSAGIFLFPISVLNIAGVLLLGPWKGFQYAYLGNLSSALFSYLLFYFLGRKALRNLSGQKIMGWRKKLAQKGLLSMLILRNFPLSFGLVSMIAAASNFSFKEYTLGTMLGMLPSLILICFLTEGVRQAVYPPNPKWLALALLGCIMVFAACRQIRNYLQSKLELDWDQKNQEE